MSRMSAASAARTAAGGKVFVTPMMRMAAGSRPARRATSATAARNAAARAATSSGKEPGLRERARDLRQRETDHVGERAVDARDERRTAPLDRIAARLVERVAALHVRRDHGGAAWAEAHAREHALDGRGRGARCQVVGPRGAWYHGLVGRGVWGALLVLAACLARPAPLAPGAREGVRGPRGEPLASGLAALVAGDGAEAAHLFADAARRYPPLADYALYFEARAAMSVGRGADRRARRLTERIREAHPDVFGGAEAEAGEAEMRLGEGDLAGARAVAAAVLDSAPTAPIRARALWVRAQAEHALGRAAEAEATC